MLARAYMHESTDATTGTDQPSATFWERVTATYDQYRNRANSVNKALPRFKEFPERKGDSLSNCWSRRLQKAVAKFSGICTTHPPASGEKKDDAKMDLYYTKMRELYTQRAKLISALPNKFDEMMGAFHFLSTHAKFRVHFPDGETPLSVRKVSQVAIKAPPPPREKRPVGRDIAKMQKKQELVVSQVKKEIMQSSSESTLSSNNEDVVIMLKQANETMQAMAKHQVMNQAPTPVKKQYFDELYKSTLMEARMKKQKLEVETQMLDIQKAKLEVEMMELDNRKKLAMACSGGSAEDNNTPKCSYPDCKETLQGSLDKCGNDGCESGLLFHHCCQITFLEKHDEEITTKRCYECAQEILLGLSN